MRSVSKSRLLVRISESGIAYGAFTGAVRLLDTYGRGESAMELYKFLPTSLQFLGNPLLSPLLIVLGFLSLHLLNRKTKAFSPQLINPETRRPFEPSSRPVLFRLALAVAIPTVIAFGFWILLRFVAPTYAEVTELPISPAAPGSPAAAMRDPEQITDSTARHAPVHKNPQRVARTSQPTSQPPAQTEQQPSTQQSEPTRAPSTETFVENGRSFTRASVLDLLEVFKGRTEIQGDKLLAHYKGLWIKVRGTLVGASPNPPGYAVFVKDGESQVDCRNNKPASQDLGSFNRGDIITVQGIIGPVQNGGQIYLIDCEVKPSSR